jgi:SAM-dependent methyltransferase
VDPSRGVQAYNGGVSSGEEAVARAKQAWDSLDWDLNWQVSWRNIPQIYASTKPYHQDATGQSFIDYELHRTFPEDRLDLRAAALVCGNFRHEREIFHDRYKTIRFAEVHGYDLSEVNLRSIRDLPFRFVPHVVDCNNLTLDHGSFQFIAVHDGVHHVYNVSNLFFQCNQALKDGGLMYIAEYIGPRYVQIPRMNYWISWLLLALLFSKQERTTHEGRLKGRWQSYPPGTLDPSEACNTEPILPEMKHYFEVEQILYFGGLCFPMFEGLGRNFPKPSWRFPFVVYLERALQHLGIIQPMFMHAILRKKKVW